MKTSKSDEEAYGRRVPRQDEGGDDRLASVGLPAIVPTSQAQSFGYKLNEDVYRCMLCLRGNLAATHLEFAEASQRFKSRALAARPREQHRPQRG